MNSTSCTSIYESDALCVAVAQPLVVPGDVEGNIDRMAPMVAEAARRGAHLVVFSEAQITGYDMKGIGAAAAVPFDAPVLDRVVALARTHHIVIIAGLYEQAGETVHNAAIAFYPDGRRVVQRKFNVVGCEMKVAQSGERERTFFEVNGMQCAVLICADAGIPNISQELAAAGCDVQILITAGGGRESLGKRQVELADAETRNTYFEAATLCLSKDTIQQAMELDMGMVACNQSGWVTSQGYYHGGGSSIIDRTGRVSAVIPYRSVLEHVKPDLATGTISRRILRGSPRLSKKEGRSAR